LLDGSKFDAPSTKVAADLLTDWGKDTPIVLVAQPDEENVIKSFRNLDRVLVLQPSELEIGALVWARSLLVTQDALDRVQEVSQ
jgi:large subunit ribosomal protein L4